MTAAAAISPEPDAGRTRLVAGLGLLLLWLTVFTPALSGRLVDWDDSELITGNGMLQPGGWPIVWHSWREPAYGLYAPLTFTVQATVAAAARAAGYGLRPEVFHGLSVLMHGVGGLLMWRLLKCLCGRELPAAAGAAVWLVHPLQAETVAWASGFNGVLGGVLAIAALWMNAEGVTRIGRSRTVRLTLAALLVAMSLLAKPSSVLLPVALVGVNRFVLRRPWAETLRWAGVWLLIVVPFALIGRTAQVTGFMEPAPPFAERPLVALHAAGFYLLKIVWPVGLAADYGLSPANVLLQNRLWVAPTAALLAAVVAAIWLRRKRQAWAVGGLLVYLAAIGPVLGLVPFYFQNYSTVADRYAYFALTGVAIVVAMALGPLRPPALRASVGVVVVLLAALTSRQITFWHDTLALFTHTYAVNPTSVAANGQLGMLAQQRRDLPFAERAYRFVLAHRSWDTGFHSRLGEIFVDTGRPAQGVAEFARVAADMPTDFGAFNNLGIACVAAGHDADAREAFTRAVRLKPDFAPAHARLGDVQLRLGDSGAAAESFAAALRLDPRQPIALRGVARLPATTPVSTRPAGN